MAREIENTALPIANHELKFPGIGFANCFRSVTTTNIQRLSYEKSLYSIKIYISIALADEVDADLVGPGVAKASHLNRTPFYRCIHK